MRVGRDMTGFLHDDGRLLLACRFTHAELPQVRHQVAWQAAVAGLAGMRWDDFVLAVHEAAVNAVGHGGGEGWLLLWCSGAVLRCQISDDGPGAPARSLNGSAMPEVDGTSGRGMWLISRLADEVNVVTSEEGTLLQIAFRLPG